MSFKKNTKSEKLNNMAFMPNTASYIQRRQEEYQSYAEIINYLAVQYNWTDDLKTKYLNYPDWDSQKMRDRIKNLQNDLNDQQTQISSTFNQFKHENPDKMVFAIKNSDGEIKNFSVGRDNSFFSEMLDGMVLLEMDVTKTPFTNSSMSIAVQEQEEKRINEEKERAKIMRKNSMKP